MDFLNVAVSTWSLLLLVVVLAGGLFLIPLGLPGLWIMLGGAVLHSFLVPESGIGVVTLVGCTALVVVAEVLEFSLAGTYARKYGGSKRSGWGAMLGGIVGTFIGIPVPVVGPIIGAFLGAFVGAFLGELTISREERGVPTRVAFGAVVGRVVASAIKVGLGVVIGAWILMRAF